MFFRATVFSVLTTCLLALPIAAKRPQAIYFIGDSVTAGYTYLPNNLPISDNWVSFVACHEPRPPDNRCSNNLNAESNLKSPYIAYAFQFADWLHANEVALNKELTPVHNMAISASTPSEWDKTIIANDQSPFPGIFSHIVDKLPNDILTVLTLGANPLMARWLYVKVAIADTSKTLLKGVHVDCADSVEHATQCVAEDIRSFKLKEHLVNIYKRLLGKGDVLVQLYYHTCSWDFANNDPDIHFAKPSLGKPCADHLKPIATTVIGIINQTIKDAVKQATQWAKTNKVPGKIAYICPGNDKSAQCGEFADHLAFSEIPWITQVDTGIHPNPTGHSVLARGVREGVCEKLGLYCDDFLRGPVYWEPARLTCSTLDEYAVRDARCVYLALYNNTGKTLSLGNISISHGEWYQRPENSIAPGDTTRAIAIDFSGELRGVKGHIRYDNEDGQINLSFHNPNLPILGGRSYLKTKASQRLKIIEASKNTSGDLYYLNVEAKAAD